ncbi:MAG: hypothetical protein BWY76_02175 [bacterium ADurb.Bin429]|nr:MAG: hypothetical protein BWY76_02175 [bacterium ADurb.Bin429]
MVGQQRHHVQRAHLPGDAHIRVAGVRAVGVAHGVRFDHLIGQHRQLRAQFPALLWRQRRAGEGILDFRQHAEQFKGHVVAGRRAAHQVAQIRLQLLPPGVRRRDGIRVAGEAVELRDIAKVVMIFKLVEERRIFRQRLANLRQLALAQEDARVIGVSIRPVGDVILIPIKADDAVEQAKLIEKADGIGAPVCLHLQCRPAQRQRPLAAGVGDGQAVIVRTAEEGIGIGTRIAARHGELYGDATAIRRIGHRQLLDAPPVAVVQRHHADHRVTGGIILCLPGIPETNLRHLGAQRTVGLDARAHPHRLQRADVATAHAAVAPGLRGLRHIRLPAVGKAQFPQVVLRRDAAKIVLVTHLHHRHAVNDGDCRAIIAAFGILQLVLRGGIHWALLYHRRFPCLHRAVGKHCPAAQPRRLQPATAESEDRRRQRLRGHRRFEGFRPFRQTDSE